MQVGFLWQWPVATILLAAMCQDGRVKHAIVSLAPGCCSLLSRTLNSWPCYSGFRRNSLAHASIAAVPPGRAPHFHLHLHRYAHRHPHRHSHPHSHLYSHPHPHLHFELKGRAHSALEGFVGARCSLQCWTTCKACTARAVLDNLCSLHCPSLHCRAVLHNLRRAVRRTSHHQGACKRPRKARITGRW